MSKKGKPERASGRGCLVGFFAIFLLFGLGFLIPFFIVPAARTLEARSWTPTTCEVISSRVGSSQGDDGMTYRVEMLFEHIVGGDTYRADRYDFFPGYTSGYDRKAAIVERHPPGARVPCRYDPEEPWNAVIHTGFRLEYLFALLPLIFVVVGAVGIAASLGAWRFLGSGTGKGAARRVVRAASEVRIPRRGRQARRLGKGGSGLGGLVVTAFLAAFWNGIVGVFVWQLVRDWRQGSPDWFLALFLIPFVAIGLVILLSIPYQILALFNPRPDLTLTPGAVPVGGTATLAWRFDRSVERVRRLVITLEGREEVEVRDAKGRQSTERHVFFRRRLLDSRRFGEIGRGERAVEIPPDVMHTFAAGGQRVAWTLELAGEIPLWPDVGRTVDLEVAPATAEAG